ncbi:MAG: CmcI family methyltransferase, partial [Candidatus Omnitrophota bacterium]|nr:CmcI family methyltransferase [Candidatus Omnitrophota bacterium]
MKKAKNTNKRVLTRQQFEEVRIKLARHMAADKRLLGQVLKTQVMAGKHTWLCQANWFGEPVLRFPQDMFAVQEIIYKTRPEYIIEVGVAWG